MSGVIDWGSFPEHFALVPGTDDTFVCECCARLRKIDLGDPKVEVWECMSGGWLSPVVCADCRLSLPVIVDGDESPDVFLRPVPR